MNRLTIRLLCLFVFTVFFSSKAFGKNIAIILDATESLSRTGVLSKYIENVKTLIEIISATERNPEITIVKFGAVGESEFIFSGRLSLKDRDVVQQVFDLIDGHLSEDRLYKYKTSFYEGFSKLLSETTYRYDTTIFITDGLDNDNRKTLQDLLKEYQHSIPRLGKIMFVFVPPDPNTARKAQSIVTSWSKQFGAELLIPTHQQFVEEIIKNFLKTKVNSYIFGYGWKVLSKDFEIEKYYDDSQIIMIITPSIELESTTASVYQGIKLTYIEISAKKVNIL